MTALYFLLFVIVGYYVLKFSLRLLFPYAMKKLTERMMKKAQEGRGGFTYTYTSGNPFAGESAYNNNSQRNNSSNGQIKVDYIPQKEEKRKINSQAGEFIDFEEVK